MTTKACLIFLALVVIAPSAPAQNANARLPRKTQLDPEVLKRSGRYVALVIGNNDYTKLPKLETAVKDATDISNILRTLYGFEVKLLLNATRADVMGSLSAYRRSLTDVDNLLIYYAGHGHLDNGANRAYWLPVDAEKENNANWISADDITGDLRAMAPRHILVIADSCYSGGLRGTGTDANSTADMSEYLRQKKEKRSRTLLSSGALEPVSDGGGAVNSVFAEAVIRGLSGTEDQAFSGGRFYGNFVEVRVPGRAHQTPLYKRLDNSGDEGGDFIFIRDAKPAAPASAATANSALDYHNRGITFMEDGKWAEAEAEYKTAVSLVPNNAIYRMRLGDTLFNLRKYAESENELREAARLDPANADYRNMLGNAIWSQGRIQDSEKPFREGLRLQPDYPWLNYNLAGVLNNRSDFVGAEPYARKAAELAPNNPDFHFRFGSTLRGLKRPEARNELAMAVQLNPKLDAAWNELGVTCYDTADFSGALSSFKKAIELVPNSAPYHSNVASSLFNLNRFVEAEVEARDAVRLDEGSLGHYWLGRILYAVAKYQDAESPMRRAVIQSPGDGDRHNWLGNSLYRQNRWDDSILEYKEAVRLDPKSGVYLLNLARALANAHRLVEAEASYKQAIGTAPTDLDLQRNYGVFLFDQNRFADAKAIFESVRTGEPANAQNWSYSGITLVRLKDFAQAESLLRHAVDLDKSNALYRSNLGEALEGQNKLLPALLAYLTAQKLSPSASITEKVDRVRALLETDKP